ncbi:hypothetical protein PR048_019007 [Dryococelus australis]|uniref:Uncharacterized protein n=1 Tax=Dryococelus australis TaxID=614101 RepID=A0ABQ9H296_9NEOP|nr:hypothetical protein PR048_019007 [Dryococelus australis]
MRGKRCEYGAAPERKGGVKGRIPERIRRPAASSGKIPNAKICERPRQESSPSHTDLGIVAGMREPSGICADPSSEMSTVQQKALCVMWFAEFNRRRLSVESDGDERHSKLHLDGFISAWILTQTPYKVLPSIT